MPKHKIKSGEFTFEEMIRPLIEPVIFAIRDSFVGAEHVYTHGSCYYFAQILKRIYPTGQLFENHEHVYFKLDDKFYDIRGEVSPPDPEGPAALHIAEHPTKHGKWNMVEYLEFHKPVGS